MAKKMMVFGEQRYHRWLIDLINNGSVMEDHEPIDIWETAYEDPVLRCWQPNGKIITVYPGDKIKLGHYNNQKGLVIKYAELVD